MSKILVSDPIAQEGIDLLGTQAQVDVKLGMKPEELLEVIGGYDALVVRSETKVTREVIETGSSLRVVARAGIGVDNIDLTAATGAGIAVVNAPTGNTVAAAEHTVALMLALARNIPDAHHSVKDGQWRRSAFMGIEVRNKTLGIAGLGRVGSEVARRARSFGMRLVGFDPFVSPEYARQLGAELMTLDELLAVSDFITLHTPLTDSTNKLIGAPQLEKLKPGARLINVARGRAGGRGRAAGGVGRRETGRCCPGTSSPRNPPWASSWWSIPRVVATPHLGASTEEAQREVAIEAAEQALAVLNGEPARNTVNAPFVAPEVHAVLAPYMNAAAVTGRLLTHLAEGQFMGLTIRYEGEIARHDSSMLKSAVLAGLLGPITGNHVNLINAPVVARERGLRITEQYNEVSENYAGIISATLETSDGPLTLGCTTMRDEPHIVKVNDYWVDIVTSVPYMLFVDNIDQPGSIGAVGTIAGRHNINISFMEVGRLQLRGHAMMIIGLDDPVPAPVLEEIRALSHIRSARLVTL